MIIRHTSREIVLPATIAVLSGVLIAEGYTIVLAGLIIAVTGGAFLLLRPVQGLWLFFIGLPFFIYPAGIGSFSIFIGLPAALALSLGLFAASSARYPKPLRLPVIPFLLLISLAFLSAIASSNPLQATSRVVYLLSFGLFGGGIAYARTAGLIQIRDVIVPFLMGAILAAAALIGQFALQFAIGTGALNRELLSIYGLFGGSRATTATQGVNWTVPQFGLLRSIFPFMAPPSAGQYMMIAVVTAIAVKRYMPDMANNRWSRWTLFLLVPALVATLSRQSWVGALVAVAFITFQARPARLIIGIFVIAALAFAIPAPGTHETFGQYLLLSTDVNSHSSKGRVVIWSAALEHITHDTALGVGPGLYSTLTVGPSVYYAHNVLLDALVELGLLGGCAFIALMLSLIRLTWHRSRDLAFPVLLAVVVANMFDDVLYFPRNGFVFAGILALTTVTAVSEVTVQKHKRAIGSKPRGNIRPVGAIA